MSIYSIIPIEYSGMSIITVIVLFFGTVGGGFVLKWICERFDKQDEKIAEHDRFVDDVRANLADNRVQFAEMNGAIQQTRMIVDRIDKSVSDIAKTNIKLLETLYKKQ